MCYTAAPARVTNLDQWRHRSVRVFISSVRKGLEEERDSLPGFITALGHTPVYFEGVSAQTTPSREVCLSSLESADVYLLLLGPNYGHVFPETGQSATHDEWVHAQHLGKPRLAFRKSGVTFEDKQHDFARMVEAYGTGVFRSSFSSTPELQTQIALALRELESKPSPLEFARLTNLPSVFWIADSDKNSSVDSPSLLELHVLPIENSGYSVREFGQLADSLENRIRRTGYIESRLSLNLSKAQDHAVVIIEHDRRDTWDSIQIGEIREVWLHKTGQVSVRATLPKDRMGSILDPEALPNQLAEMLRFTGAMDILQQGPVVAAVGVLANGMISIDHFDPHHSRTRAQGIGFGNPAKVYRTEPDESVSLAALDNGAAEVGGNLSRALLAPLQT